MKLLVVTVMSALIGFHTEGEQNQQKWTNELYLLKHTLWFPNRKATPEQHKHPTVLLECRSANCL